MLDVDHFKGYNDAYGHGAGNRCLQTVAMVMRTSARRPDDWVGRIGGEEFAILLSDTGIEGARAVAVNIIQKLQSLSLEHKASEFERVTISIRAAVGGPTSSVREQQLFDAADRALYKAKREGRNRLEFDEVEKSIADTIDDGPIERLHSPNRSDGDALAGGKG